MRKRTALFGWGMVFVTLLFSCLKSETAGFTPATLDIEGFEWKLMDVDGEAVSPLEAGRRPFVKFDPAQKQATGFAGCNNFFGSYELDGPSLKFGPIGATRMFCEGVAGEVEMKFMEALAQTRAWERRGDTLLLLDGGNILARFMMAIEVEAPAELESMPFLSSWFPSGKVTLSGGVYRKPAAPGSATEIVVRLSDKRAFGLINGRETGAVVLVTETGGSGTFYDLALLSKEAAGWVNTDAVPLGDRVKVHAIEIAGDGIVVPMKTHGPGDPMCCPTLEVEKRFAVQGNRLLISAEVAKAEEPQITGPVWQWMQTLYNDDRKAVPVDPENYTLLFREDGSLNVKADCNLKGGTYNTDGKHIAIEITHSTMAACPEDSLEDEFVRNLTAGAIFFFSDNDLYLDLKYDTGTMKFSKKTKEIIKE